MRNKKHFYWLPIMIILVFITIIKYEPPKFEYPDIEVDSKMQIYLPYYIPKDYKLGEFNVDRPFVSISFENESQTIWYTQIHTGGSFSFTTDTEHHKITEYESEKFSGYLSESIKYPEDYALYIFDDNNYYEISGTIDKHELFKIAESIEKYIP